MPHNKNGTLDLSVVSARSILMIWDSQITIQENEKFETISHFYSRQDLFPHAPQISDVKQANIGDCFLLAALHSIINIDPLLIEDMMRDLREGWVVVRLFDGSGQPIYYAVEKTYVVKKTGVFSTAPLQGHGAYWVYMLEKAYALFRLRVEKHELTPKKWVIDRDTNRPKQVSEPKRAAVTYTEALTGGYSEDAIQTLLGGQKVRHKIQAEDKSSWAAGILGIAIARRPGKKSTLNENQVLTAIFSDDALAKSDFLGRFASMTVQEFSLVATNGRTVRRERLSEFFDKCYGMLKPGTRRHLDVFASANFPGKRGTGLYTAYQLELYRSIKRALAARNYVAIGSGTNLGRNPGSKGATNEHKVKGVAGPHAYHVCQVMKTTTDPELRFLKVRNPWLDYVRDYDWKTKTVGTEDIRVLTARERVQLDAPRTVTGPFGAVGPGEFLLELSDFTKRFKHLMIGSDPAHALTSVVALQPFVHD